MPNWVKISLVSALAVLLLAAGGLYLYLKSMGVIPRHDYDSEPPALPAFTRPAVLVFNKTNGFRHKDAIPVADRMFTELAQAQGWDVFVTDNAAVHNPGVLDRFRLVVWNNVSGDVLTAEQRHSLRQWIEAGGGWLGVHAAGGDLTYAWEWYVDTLIGAQFIGHTMDPQFQDASVLVEDAAIPVTDHLPPAWRVPHEEWYAFDASPRGKGYEILLTLDKDSYISRGPQSMGWIDVWNDRMEGEHPLAWRHTLGNGRVFYSSIGHLPDTYRLPEYRQLLSKAMRWTMNAGDERE